MLCWLQIPAAMKYFLSSAFADIFVTRGSPNDCDCFKVLRPADHAAPTQVTPCKNVHISLGDEKIVLLVLRLFGFLYTTNNIDPVVNVFPKWFTLSPLCKAGSQYSAGTCGLVAQWCRGSYQWILQLTYPWWCVIETQGLTSFWNRLVASEQERYHSDTHTIHCVRRALPSSLEGGFHATCNWARLPPVPLAGKWVWTRAIVWLRNLWAIRHSDAAFQPLIDTLIKHAKCLLWQQICFAQSPSQNQERRVDTDYKWHAMLMKILIDTNKLFILFQMFIHSDFTNAAMCRHSQMFPVGISMQRDQLKNGNPEEKSTAVFMEYLVILNLPLRLTYNCKIWKVQE